MNLVALAGPPREKPHLSSRINAGTAEPVRVSPPEAVAYPLELLGRFRNHRTCADASTSVTGHHTSGAQSSEARISYCFLRLAIPDGAASVTSLPGPPAQAPSASRPPSTATYEPVMNDAFSDARNSTAFATSSACPMRPSGWILPVFSSCSLRLEPLGNVARTIGVSIAPGHTASTRILSAA